MIVGLNLRNVSLMVVDDSDFMRGLLVEILRAFGCQRIIGANNGQKAIDYLANDNPDILVTDWLMSPVDGIELTKYVRRNPSSLNPVLPIIMLTGYTCPGAVTTARDAGVTEMLAKPFCARALYSRISHIIECPRAFIRAAAFCGPDRRRHVTNYRDPERRVAATPEVIPDGLASSAEIHTLRPGQFDRGAPPSKHYGANDLGRARHWAEKASVLAPRQRQLRRLTAN